MTERLTPDRLLRMLADDRQSDAMKINSKKRIISLIRGYVQAMHEERRFSRYNSGIFREPLRQLKDDLAAMEAEMIALVELPPIVVVTLRLYRLRIRI